MLPGRVSGLLALALGLFIVAAIALSFNLARLRESFAFVEHTNEVLRNIAAAERALLKLSLGERGYLLTGESTYRDSYDRAQAQIPGLLESLRQFVSDNPDQTRHLIELRISIEARLDEFKQAVELGRARLNEALAILSTARSRQFIPQIEQQLSQFTKAELSLLEERQRNADRVTVLATAIAAAMGILALLCAAIGAFLLERQRTIGQLQAANQFLREAKKT